MNVYRVIDIPQELNDRIEKVGARMEITMDDFIVRVISAGLAEFSSMQELMDECKKWQLTEEDLRKLEE